MSKPKTSKDAGCVPPDLVDPMMRAIEQHARSYARRLRGRVSIDDMRGEALLVCVKAARDHYDPLSGDEPAAYFGRCAQRAIAAFIVKAQSPVSGSIRSGRAALIAATAGKLSYESAIGEQHDDRRAVDNRNRTNSKLLRHIETKSAERHWTQDVLDDERRRVAILSRMLQKVSAEGRPFIEATMSGEEPANEDERRRLDRARHAARKSLRGDPVLCELVRSRP